MAGKYDIIANTSDTLPNMEDSSNIEDDPMDISTKISNLYHLLDLRKDMGPNGFAVDKIIISQNSLKKLCNIIVPNSFKSISEINYASLNSKSLNLTGIYGTRESIAKYLLQSKLIDEQIHSQLVQSQTIKDNNNKPSLKTGIYLLIRNGHGLVIHWPEEDCYNIRASSQKRKNAVTLHRYFTKLTDVHFCLLNEEDLKTFDFNLRKKSSNEDEDDEDEDIDTEYTVKQVQQDRTDFNILKGFELNLPRSKKVINTKLTLPPSFPSAMSIESCHHQSFITCHINEPQEISEYDEHTDTFSGLQYFISEYLNRQDYSLQISSLIEIEDLFNLAYILQVEEELPVSYVAEIEKATDDNKKLEKDEKDIIAVDSDSLTNMYKDRLQFIYGLFDKNLDIPMDDSEQDRIKKEYSDVINKLESSIKDINSPKWKEYKKRFLSIQKSVESSANQEEQPLIYIIYQNLFENKSNYDKLIQNLKDFHKKLLKIPDQEDIPEIPDQQFIQSYLNNKEFDNYPDIKEEIIKLFYNEYTTWRDTFLNSIGDLVKDSQKFQNMSTKLQNNLEIRTHEIGKDYIKKICDNIKKKYNNNGSNRFVVKKVVSKKQKFKLEFELIKKRPSFITFTIYETHIDSEDVQNLFEDPNYVPTPQLQQRISNIGKYYYGQEFYFNSSRYIFKKIFQLKSRHILLFLWDYSTNSLELSYGQIQQRRNFKLLKEFKVLKENTLIDINEPLGLILLYEPESTRLSVYKFLENPFELALHLRVDRLFEDNYANILKVIFVQCTENLCFIEKNGKASIFSGKTKQFLSRKLEFPSKTLNALSSPDGNCIVAFTNERQKSKAYVYFAPNFEVKAQKVIELPLSNEELKFCNFSYISDKQVHLSYIDLNQSCFKSLLIKISVDRMEFQFQRATKISLGHAKPLRGFNDYSEIHGDKTSFQSDFEVGDYIIIENEKKLITEIASDDRLIIEDCFSENLLNKWHSFKILPKSKLNGLIDIYADTYEKFPINPCIDDGTNKAPQLYIFLDCEQALSYKENFENYIVKMLDRVKMSTQKPATILNHFKINVNHYQDLFDNNIIRQYTSKFQLGEWIIQLCCLIPIQIAVAKENKLIPLYNGLDAPDNYNITHNKDDDNYTEIISSKISFGWYEGIFKYLGDRKVKVVSSMGEQSCGKSYLMNHLVGTNFDGSAMRCTEGAWMSLSITKETIYVALDFEGLGSLERTPQEDLLLTLLNASLSNMILFKNQFVINRQMSSTFRSFQNGANQLKNDSKIFKARLCMIIKDVPKHARKEIKKEFEQKFQQIVAKEGIDNFISRIYSGEVDIYAWPMFNDMTWYTTLDKVKEKLDKREPTYDNAHYFIDYIKSMLAKLMVCDWSPLDEAIVYRRVSTLKRLLNSAINMGIEQTEPFVHELLDRSTGAKIPEPEKLIDNFSEIDDLLSKNSKLVLSKDLKNKINNSPLPKDSLLLLYKNDYNLVDISRYLISFFEEHIMERKSAEKDEIWFNNLRIFLDYIVKRRINRVKSWYKQNTASFSQDNSHIIQGNNLLLQEISKLTVFWNLCGIKCSICKLYCLKQRDHDNDHDCLTDHKCHFDCQFDEKHFEQNVPKEVCKHEAGHDGKHICDKIRHECGEPCYLSDKRNCNQYCTNEVGHSNEMKHMCNSVHQCGAECSLKINTRYTQYKCPNYCVLPYDKQHDKNEHCCESESCPMPCPIPTCKNKCKSKNHHHALESAGINHLCGNEHPCPKECESPGICRAEIIEQKAVYHGLRSDIDYTKFVQIKKRLPCSKKIPANKTFHDGPHIHLENAMHTCEVKCPLCEYYCTLPYGHTGLHYTTHGNMNLTVFVAEDDDFEYRGYKLKIGDRGVFEFCNMHCKNSRRHRHIDYCEYRNKPIGLFGSESRKFRNHFEDKEDGVRHIRDIAFKPHPELPKDFLSHEQFWARTGFEDPYTALEQEDFAKCDHECPDEIHQKSIDSLPPEKSYCDLQLFHDPISTLPIGKKGYLSNDGHVFLCRDPRVAAFHVIFVLDRSSSMSGSDHPPTSDSRFGRSLQENFNNRLGAALQATDQFIKTRISSTQNQNKSTTIVNDIVSVIFFDRYSEVLFENKSIFDTDFIQNKLIEKGTGKGTRFSRAIKKTEQVIDKYFDISRLNVVMFLSDGEEHFPENELVDMCRKNKDKGSPIFFNTIHFGHSSSGAGVLQKMAETAQTYHDTSYSNNNMQCKFVRAPDTICLIDNFTEVAISLLVHKPILMQG